MGAEEVGGGGRIVFASEVPVRARRRREIAMAHLHEKIDFTVSLFIVEKGKLLLIHHRKLDRWLPIGGHIELDEDPEQAARLVGKGASTTVVASV